MDERPAARVPPYLSADGEQRILESLRSGKLLGEISESLAKELHEAGLLRPLLLRRIANLTLDGYEHQRQQTEGDDYPESNDPPGGEPIPCQGAQMAGLPDSRHPLWISLAKEWFAPHTERRYLERRATLDRVSFRMLRTATKGVILEAQQRLLAKEEDWLLISQRWGQPPERDSGGRVGSLSPAKLAKPLVAVLRRLEPGELSQPIRLGKHFAMVELDRWFCVELDEAMRRRLEQEMLLEWMERNLQQVLETLPFLPPPEEPSAA
jgi:hypothetical protein